MCLKTPFINIGFNYHCEERKRRSDLIANQIVGDYFALFAMTILVLCCLGNALLVGSMVKDCVVDMGDFFRLSKTIELSGFFQHLREVGFFNKVVS